MKFILILVMLFSTVYAQTDSPSTVVNKALTALTNGDIKRLTELTENAELRQAKELLASMNSTRRKDEIMNQYKSLKSWDIVDETEHFVNGRNIAIVSTVWVVIDGLEMNPKSFSDAQTETTMYINYMLERFDGEWKIISRRSLN